VKDLEQLVEVEIRLDELLRAARSEGEGLVAQARERVARAEALWSSDLEAGRRDLEARTGEERDRELARLREEADRDVAHYDGQTPEQIEILARWVATELRGSARGAGS
jgi:hypothetical protein